MLYSHKYIALLLVWVLLFLSSIACASVEDGLKAYKNKNYSHAFRIFKKNANKGDADAALYLGVMYNEGTSPSIDNNKALKWFKFSAENGNAIAPFEYGTLISKGATTKRNKVVAKIWYDRGMDKLDELKELAWSGNDFAAIVLSLLFNDSFHQEISKPELSFFWVERAANNGHPQGTYHLAYSYIMGIGTPKDRGQAIKLFYESAESGFAWSQETMAAVCNGDAPPKLGCDKNWLEEASNHGHMGSYLRMADYALEKTNHMENLDEIIEWYKKAIASQDTGGEAAYKLAKLYYQEKYTKPTEKHKNNLELSHQLFSTSLERGYTKASMYLAYMYKNSIHVEKNLDKAIIFYLQTAGKDFNYSFSQSALGDIYEKKDNNSKAEYWYKKAVENGNKEAKESLMGMRWNWPENNKENNTVSYFKNLLKHIFFLPGDGILYLIDNMDGYEDFFEITYDSYGGWFAGVFSIFVWLIALVGIGSTD